MSTRPTLENVLNARKRIMPHIIRTPLLNYYGIDEMLDAKVFIKHENFQHLGSFKVRGALNTISQLTSEEKMNEKEGGISFGFHFCFFLFAPV